MNFPEKYIKHGTFKLHSGDISTKFYDVNALITEHKYLNDIINSIPIFNCYVGIATCGAIIASHFYSFAMVKDGELKGKVCDEYCLIDDVVTTENSINEAIKIIGKNPKYIFVVVDRRKIKNLEIVSMYSD